MKRKFNKENIMKTWEENKKLIITTGVIVGGVISTAAILIINKNNKGSTQDIKDNILELMEDHDYGRECIITYSVKDTGEILWKGLCTESYVNAMKNDDMRFEEIRRLNGLE